MPIDFVEMLHGESLETMDSTEKLLCKHKLNVLRVNYIILLTALVIKYISST